MSIIFEEVFVIFIREMITNLCITPIYVRTANSIGLLFDCVLLPFDLGKMELTLCRSYEIEHLFHIIRRQLSLFDRGKLIKLLN